MEGSKNSEDVLKGKTLAIYVYFLHHRQAAGASEIQKALGISSASVVMHHMQKLVDLGAVIRDEAGKYVLVNKVDTSVLRGFINLYGFILPRFAFYAGLFAALGIGYVVLYYAELNYLALIGLIGALIIFSYETWRSWKRKAF